MAGKFDVSSRLDEGRPAVDTVAQYVWASHQVGYQHPDLTLHAAQVRDWYGSEDGMDLQALQRDCTAFDDAVRATQEALAVQERQPAALSAAWQGAGAQASQDFLYRHGAASAAVAAAVRTAADALRAVGEDLWRAVDAKVGAVVNIEGRAAGARADWLAAATTVISGAGDRAAAAELVDSAVKPFVDNVIRTEWLSTMRTTMASVVDAYQGATSEITGEAHPRFEVPGDLGPTAPQSVAPPAPLAAPAASSTPVTVAPVPTAPSAWAPPPAAAVPPPPDLPPAQPAALPSAVPPAAPMPAMGPTGSPVPGLGGGMPGLGGGMPGLGGGMPGLGQHFADALSGLLGGGPGDMGPGVEPPDLEPPDLEPPDEGADDTDNETDGETDDEAPGTDEDTDEKEVDETTGDEPATDEPAPEENPVEVPVDTATAPAPAPTPPPPPAEPLPPVEVPPGEPVADAQTPCAIAADEVPQVGDPPE